MLVKLNFKTQESLELRSSEQIIIQSTETTNSYTYITFKAIFDIDIKQEATNWLKIKFVTDVVTSKDNLIIKIRNNLLINTIIQY